MGCHSAVSSSASRVCVTQAGCWGGEGVGMVTWSVPCNQSVAGGRPGSGLHKIKDKERQAWYVCNAGEIVKGRGRC